MGWVPILSFKWDLFMHAKVSFSSFFFSGSSSILYGNEGRERRFVNLFFLSFWKRLEISVKGSRRFSLASWQKVSRHPRPSPAFFALHIYLYYPCLPASLPIYQSVFNLLSLVYLASIHLSIYLSVYPLYGIVSTGVHFFGLFRSYLFVDIIECMSYKLVFSWGFHFNLFYREKTVGRESKDGRRISKAISSCRVIYRLFFPGVYTLHQFRFTGRGSIPV